MLQAKGFPRFSAEYFYYDTKAPTPTSTCSDLQLRPFGLQFTDWSGLRGHHVASLVDKGDNPDTRPAGLTSTGRIVTLHQRPDHTSDHVLLAVAKVF